MITPFDENQNINSQATCQLIDYLIEKGIYGLFILGTNGECHCTYNPFIFHKIIFPL
ncbi:dihydrodipicolinate synthase family protein [Clostridioides difficile]